MLIDEKLMYRMVVLKQQVYLNNSNLSTPFKSTAPGDTAQ